MYYADIILLAHLVHHAVEVLHSRPVFILPFVRIGYAGAVVDVEGYRARRERQLRQLARRMAEQAIRTGKRQLLEPMSSAERRIVHLELRDHDTVTTESVGEEPNRKVSIVLKK